MNKDWEEKSEKAVKKYNKEILKILQETGASGVIPLIKGLQKKIKTMEVREKNADEQSYARILDESEYVLIKYIRDKYTFSEYVNLYTDVVRPRNEGE